MGTDGQKELSTFCGRSLGRGFGTGYLAFGLLSISSRVDLMPNSRRTFKILSFCSAARKPLCGQRSHSLAELMKKSSVHSPSIARSRIISEVQGRFPRRTIRVLKKYSKVAAAFANVGRLVNLPSAFLGVSGQCGVNFTGCFRAFSLSSKNSRT